MQPRMLANAWNNTFSGCTRVREWVGCMPMASKGRILLADDDTDLQLMVKRAAARQGYEVTSVQIGLEVVALAAQLQPDLLVLDIRFPDADGRDLLQQLKENPSTTAIPVIVWSGSQHESVRRTALALGAEYFVDKRDPQSLLPKIAQILLQRLAPESER